ncbi:ZIP-like iron-zinc transporter [Rickenella mellea]|uniref:ZIP-like iron-zinc transporter n=1 Tax=Rickenella mellea TaxID=50990 RepID=A0A4Y7Q9S6_9AGAM|nr:ZIP-like iron-zinc transporter [Rickenella mellea]
MSSTTDSSPSATSTPAGPDALNCGNGGGSDDFFHLRIASIFIIMIASSFGALFPVVARRTRLNNVIPKAVFDFAKYFGSGVIIATAFIHLLSPAIDELTSPCLGAGWNVYPWPLALCMLAIFGIFFVELFAFRWGSAKLAKLGIQHDPHGHGLAGHAAHGPEVLDHQHHSPQNPDSESDIEKNNKTPEFTNALDDSAVAQIIGIFILEFGIILHSVLIGLTLAVDPNFKVLFVVLVFHQMFEGLGLGSRLAFLKLPPKYNYVATVAATLYGFTTPVGIAAGLGVRSTYNPGSAKANIVSGVMDSLSSGILLYTGLVELLAHEFLFNKEMNQASNRRLGFACGSMLLGAGLMSLLGRWA